MSQPFLTFASATSLNAVANGYCFGFNIVDARACPAAPSIPPCDVSRSPDT